MTAILIFIFSFFGAVAALSDEVAWHDFSKGYAMVKAKKRPAVIDFYTEWCSWCKVMDKKTFSEKSVKKVLNRDFVAMRLNPETSTETIHFDGKVFTPMEFYRALGGSGFPSMVFMDKQGKFITMVPGFVPPETFVQILAYVKSECYATKVTFDDYVKNGKCN